MEQSIRLLDSRHPVEDRRVRNWIGALYRLQGRYDCSFTHFRVMDLLLRRGFTFRFPPVEHPDFGERRETRAALTESTALRDAWRVRDVDDNDGGCWLAVPLIDALQATADAGQELGDRTLIADWRELEPGL